MEKGLKAEIAGTEPGIVPGPSGPYRTTAFELQAEIGVMSLALIVMAIFGQRTGLMNILIGAIIVGRFVLLNRRGDWVFFLIGVIVGGGNDLLSMWKGVYAYTPPTSLPVPIPIWMVIFWGQIFLSFRKLMRFGPFLGDGRTAPPPVDLPIILDLIVVIGYRMIVYRTASMPWVPDALYAAILALRLLLAPPAKNERLIMLTMVLVGPFYEIVLIYAGLYDYQTGVFFGMPLWLIIYWIFIVRFLKAVFDRIEWFLVRNR